MKRLFFEKKQTLSPVAEKPLPSLATCVMMDLLGFVSYGIPFFGELIDIFGPPFQR